MAITSLNGFSHQPGSNSNLLLGPKKEALERLASINLIELCNEAKVERCRATRDLRSCGRLVQYVLTSCGHASLCAECSQRCDLCPICRIPMHPNGNRIQLRLYYVCMEAGLISKVNDDRFQEKEDGGNQLAADVQRLYNLFDVAMENNLVSLICHYITDVCMDESAISSDPVVSFLLDEVVIKDWCRRSFGNIEADLRGIYALELEEMKTRVDSLLKFSSQLSGISNVLEVLESSIKGTLTAQRDLHGVQEKVLKTKQHLDIMTWCIRHQFVENIRSRYRNHEAWLSLFRERKSAATKRCWPDLITSISSVPSLQNGATLFIEDALSNLETEEETEVPSLVKEGSTLSILKSRINGVAGCYPFENLRSATDILFLCGSSDMVVAKQAIFLYYLFDRHWTMPDEEWRYIINDFAAIFSINRHSLLESLVFYLLDDHTEQALQEACRLLPEIAGPTTHPKIAEVLLERQSPEMSLMVLRWSGLEGLGAKANFEHSRTQLVSLRVAVTAVRARVDCGLLTEAFIYQRTHYMKAKEENSKHRPSQAISNDLKGEPETWLDRMEALVTEICCLSIKRNIVDRMIELPWNFEEEKFIHKCLLDYATEDPSATVGSLLVVFYLQRFRYVEAYQVDCKLQSLEQECISKSSQSTEIVSRIQSTSQWRTALVDKSIELLPRSQQQRVKNGDFDIGCPPAKEVDGVSKSSLMEAQVTNSTSLVSPLLPGSFRINSTIASKKNLASETSHGFGEHMSHSFESSNYSPSVSHKKFLTPTSDKDNLVSRTLGIRNNFPVDDIQTPGSHLFSPKVTNQSKESNRSSSKSLRGSHLRNDKFELPGREANLFANQGESLNLPYPSKVPIDQLGTLHHRLSIPSAHDLNPTFSGKRLPVDRPLMEIPAIDTMDCSWGNGNGKLAIDMDMNGGLKQRSDETSEDEAEPSLDMIKGGGVRPRRRRFSRR